MDFSMWAQYGVAGMSLALLAYALKMFYGSYKEMIEAINQLKIVIEKQSDRERIFMDMIYPIAKDTNERVRRMEERL